LSVTILGWREVKTLMRLIGRVIVEVGRVPQAIWPSIFANSWLLISGWSFFFLELSLDHFWCQTKIIGFGLRWLALAVWCICIAERSKIVSAQATDSPSFSIFSIMFEVISASVIAFFDGALLTSFKF
jgi:hypothetical protein